MWPKLNEARRRVVSIEKDSVNDHGKYRYVSAEAMIAKTRQVMVELGLLFVRDEVNLRHAEGVPYIQQVFCLTDVESGESKTISMDLPCPARKGTPEDKAAMAAMTSGLNYAIRDLLMISRGREDQVEQYNDEQYDPAAKPENPVFDQAKKLFAPADVVLDTRETPSDQDLARLRKILDSGVAGEGAEDRWLRGAEAYMRASSIEKHYTSLDEIPSAIAAKIIDRYKADYLKWAASKEAA